MKMKSLSMTLFLLVTLALTGCGTRSPESGAAPGTSARPPADTKPAQPIAPSRDDPAAIQAVFEGFLAAQKKGDVKAFMSFLTPEGQMQTAASQTYGALNQQSVAQGDGPDAKKYREEFKHILAALDKNGLTYEVTKKIKLDLSPEGHKNGTREVAALIKDPVTLFVDLDDAYSKTKGFPSMASAPPPPMTLTDVHVNGDTATGVLVIKAEGQEMKQPMKFVRVGGTWKIGSPE